MVVTSVEPQKKNPHRFNIFIDGVFAFGADEDLVVNQRLVVGKKIEKEDLDKLLFEAEVGKLMEKIYGLFSIRMRSEKEIRNYFKIKNLKLKIQNGEEISDLVIESLINKLKEKDLVNDRHFAQAWVEGRRRSKQKGIQALKFELYQKGIEREIVEEVISHQSSAVSEEDLAQKALEKKLKSWKNLKSQELKQKAYQFLARKGFEYSIIQDVVAKIDQIS